MNPQIHQIVLSSLQAQTAWHGTSIAIAIALGLAAVVFISLVLCSGGDDAGVLFGGFFGLFFGMMFVATLLDHRVSLSDVDAKCSFIETWAGKPSAKAVFGRGVVVLSYSDQKAVMGVPAQDGHAITIPNAMVEKLQAFIKVNLIEAKQSGHTAANSGDQRLQLTTGL